MTYRQDGAKKATEVMQRIFPDATDEQYDEAAQFVLDVADYTAKATVALLTLDK